MAALRLAGSLAEIFGGSVEDRCEDFVIRGLGDHLLDRKFVESRGALHELHCGESGLALRMFSPVAALFPGSFRLLAEGSLRKRPVRMIEAPLRELGVEVETEAGLPPVLVHGPLEGGRARLDGSESSQFLTGLLIALPLAREASRLEVEKLASSGYVDLTMATMEAFGVPVRSGRLDSAGASSSLRYYEIEGGSPYRPARFVVEGDWSGAAFLLVAGAIAGGPSGLEVSNLPLSSTQPDRAVLEALRLAGARVEAREDSVRVLPAPLSAFEFDATDCPDLFPPLVALASVCKGETRLRGAGRLKAKESDRASVLRDEFGALGVEILVEGDNMVVRGGRGIEGGRVEAHGDHRIAMAAAVAALVARGGVSIQGEECVAKSWPSFFEDLDRIRTGAP